MRARNWEIGRLKSRQDELVATLVLRPEAVLVRSCSYRGIPTYYSGPRARTATAKLEIHQPQLCQVTSWPDLRAQSPQDAPADTIANDGAR